MDEASRRLVEAFYYHGIFRVIREWIKRDIRKTPEEVAGILYRILLM
ncbi:MAG: TetR family transcriptional regulator C-terminal domain-containing protein [Atopobiaceae bacterium]|nr:TetR family transcriptional regulator C-terminal domain-containing protein [Atopobiaceae bacterium]